MTVKYAICLSITKGQFTFIIHTYTSLRLNPLSPMSTTTPLVTSLITSSPPSPLQGERKRWCYRGRSSNRCIWRPYTSDFGARNATPQSEKGRGCVVRGRRNGRGRVRAGLTLTPLHVPTPSSLNPVTSNYITSSLPACVCDKEAACMCMCV